MVYPQVLLPHSVERGEDGVYSGVVYMKPVDCCFNHGPSDKDSERLENCHMRRLCTGCYCTCVEEEE